MEYGKTNCAFSPEEIPDPFVRAKVISMINSDYRNIDNLLPKENKNEAFVLGRIKDHILFR